MGLNLVQRLVTEEYGVRVFGLPDEGKVHLQAGVEFRAGNFLDPGEVEAALEGIDFVYHLVGTTLPATSNRDPVFDVESNVLATIRLLQACVRRRIKRIVFPSSGGTVYGIPQRIPISEEHPTNPICSYGITKLTIEKYLQLFHYLHGLNYVILRIANPYGRYQPAASQQGAVGVFLTCLKEDQPITIWGDGSTVRDYIYVEDVVDAFVRAINQDSPHRTINIGTGVGTSLRDLLALMQRVTGRRARVEHREARPADVPVNILDAARARECLGWCAQTDLETGLGKTWSWLCTHAK